LNIGLSNMLMLGNGFISLDRNIGFLPLLLDLKIGLNIYT
jgi:hypothetical protein